MEEQKEKLKHVGTFRLHRGHTLFKCNLEEKVLTKFQFVEDKDRNILVEKNCVYVSALNVKNAKRKVMKRHGVDVKFINN